MGRLKKREQFPLKGWTSAKNEHGDTYKSTNSRNPQEHNIVLLRVALSFSQ